VFVVIRERSEKFPDHYGVPIAHALKCAELREADIQIGNVQLNPAQAIIVRVAVTDLLTRLAVDHELRDSLGEVWQIYELRLREVQSLIVDSINAKPGR